MKNVTYNQVFSFPETTGINIVNHMAHLVVLPAENEEITLKIDITYPDYVDDFGIEDYLSVEASKGKVEIELEEIDELADSFRRDTIKLQIWIPKGLKVSLESENNSFNVNGLENEISLSMENGACTMANCRGDLRLESENGPIKLHNHTGNVTVKLENGPLSTDGLSGDKLSVESENGAIKMRSAAFVEVDIKNENGVIYYETLPVDNANINLENENGVINLVLPAVWGFELTTETDMGVLRNKLDAPAVKVGDKYVISSGDKEATIRIKTENGMIKVGHDKHLNIDYLRNKMDQLSQAILGSKDSQDKANIQKLIDQIIIYVNRGIGAIQEEKIKDAITASVEKLRTIGENFDLNESRDKVIATVDKIGAEIQGAFQEFVKTFQDKYNAEYVKDFKERVFGQGHQHWGHFADPEFGQKVSAKVMDSLKKVMPGIFDLKEREKEEIAEQSRLKILQMLESGKITAEEAEKLLKAITKE